MRFLFVFVVKEIIIKIIWNSLIYVMIDFMVFVWYIMEIKYYMIFFCYKIFKNCIVNMNGSLIGLWLLRKYFVFFVYVDYGFVLIWLCCCKLCGK